MKNRNQSLSFFLISSTFAGNSKGEFLEENIEPNIDFPLLGRLRRSPRSFLSVEFDPMHQKCGPLEKRVNENLLSVACDTRFQQFSFKRRPLRGVWGHIMYCRLK